MENKIWKITLSLLVFFSLGWATGFVFEFDILLLLTPPLYFAFAYVIMCLLFKRRKELEIKDILTIILSFYVGFALTVLSFEKLERVEGASFLPDMLHSLIGGGVMQLFLWRYVKGRWKYLLMFANTLLAGWIFNLFWEEKISGLANVFGFSDSRYFDSFASWFAIVGSITVMIRLYGLKKKPVRGRQ